MSLVIKTILLLFLPFSYIRTENRPSYSGVNCKLIPLDHMLADIMNIKNGIYIEVGAFDGVSSSNTKLLEEYYGWTGILIEPSENAFNILYKNRPKSRCYQCALGSFQEDNTYACGDFKGHTMSSFTNRRNKENSERVLIRSLQSILDECNIQHINFFSLDTEGYELNVLKGINFNKVTFDYLLIEIYTEQYDQIVTLLAEHGYQLSCCLSNYNKDDNPGWDGTHNDYLFVRTSLITSA